MLDKIWDDVLAGPHPERGLGKFRKISVTTDGNYFICVCVFVCLWVHMYMFTSYIHVNGSS